MKKNDLFRTIQTACLIQSKQPLFGETLDNFEGNSVISTYSPELRPQKPWRSQIVENWLIVSVCSWNLFSFRCILSREGEVNIYGPGGKPDHNFQIPDAGVFTDTAIGLGYVNRIRAIGDAVYVCGQSRQIYRLRLNSGAELGQAQWQDVAGAMRQAPISEPPADDDAAALDRWLDENDAIDFVDIDGIDQRDIYVVGDEAWHWDGAQWRPLPLPTDEVLSAIKIVSKTEVYLAGHNGTLLKGNAAEGFVDLSAIEDNQWFTDVELFNGELYLAASSGLFRYDVQQKRILPQATTLKPALQDVHTIEAKEGMLWCFGGKDIAHFDGEEWTRIDHPDNPPIR